MNQKIGRNSPCWCGSGKKFKKCHLHREEQERNKKWEVIKKYKSEFGKKYCLCPETHTIKCKGSIVNAHTVSKSGNLKAISKNGHVYAFLLPVERQSEIRTANPHGLLEPYLAGINKASTFTGFCQAHDKYLFSAIEDRSFVADKEQIFLLTYRTMAREFFGKIAQAKLEQVVRENDKGLNVLEQVNYQKTARSLIKGVNAANKDLKFQKENFDKFLLAEDYERVEGFIITCGKVPNFMSSGSIFPHYDFNGNILQDFLNFNVRLKSISLNIIQSKETGYVVFSWLKTDAEPCKKFIESLKQYKKERITDAIIRLLFENFENKFANPVWWESLTAKKRRKLNRKFSDAVSLSIDIDPNSLVEDHIEYDDWDVIKMNYI